MQVASYTYQSPSSSAVQVGKLDPESVKEEKQSSASSLDTTTSTQKEAQVLEVSQTNEVEPALGSEHILDIYA